MKLLTPILNNELLENEINELKNQINKNIEQNNLEDMIESEFNTYLNNLNKLYFTANKFCESSFYKFRIYQAISYSSDLMLR